MSSELTFPWFGEYILVRLISPRNLPGEKSLGVLFWRQHCPLLVSRHCSSYPGQLRRTSPRILNQMPPVLGELPVNHGRQASSMVLTLQCVTMDISTDTLGPKGASQLDQRWCQLNSEIENALTWKRSRRIHTKQMDLFSCVIKWGQFNGTKPAELKYLFPWYHTPAPNSVSRILCCSLKLLLESYALEFCECWLFSNWFKST